MRYYLLVFLFHSFLLIGCNKKFVHKQSSVAASEITTFYKSLTIKVLAQTKKGQLRIGLRHILYVKTVSDLIHRTNTHGGSDPTNCTLQLLRTSEICYGA
jgi:hypothetical protein